MKNIEYKTLLTYNYTKNSSDFDNKLFLCGHDLKELANMCPETIPAFLKIVETHTNKIEKTDWQVVITPESKTSTDNLCIELKVTEDKYEEYKKILFDLAYIKCSNIPAELYKENLLHQQGELHATNPEIAIVFSKPLFEKRLLHTIYYNSIIKDYTVIETNIPVDEEDYNKRYSKLSLPSEKKATAKQLIKSTK